MKDFSKLQKKFKDLEKKMPPKLKKSLPCANDVEILENKISWVYTSNKTLGSSDLYKIKQEALDGKLEYNTRRN